MTRAIGLILIFIATLAVAEETVPMEVRRATPAYVGTSSSWIEQYTLGPGDVMNIGLYGRPEFNRDKIFVQPDGTISYLQANSVRAAGLSIDELRTELELALGDYFKRPRVLIAPVELTSKKYFIVGKAVENGAFVMDRPTTLIEALARAKGFETGLVEHRYAELADLSRSFVLRGGERVPVNLEALFLKGDLSQNVLIEPNDYIYVALARTSDTFLFGEVARPGVQAYSTNLTVLAAITSRGGFTPGAYREKVLVVRGSLASPQVITLNTNDVLKGKVRDMKLEPGDIVYVNARPWLVADQILDSAIGAFLQGATGSWTGSNVPAIVASPLIPQFR